MSDCADVLVLDTTGLACPMPLLKTKLALNRMAPGACLRVLATDAGSARDIPAFLTLTPHRLIDQSRDGDSYVFLIRRAEI